MKKLIFSGERRKEGKMAGKKGSFEKSFARNNAIRAKQKRREELSDPGKFGSALTDFVTRTMATSAALIRGAMGDDFDPKREALVVRPMVKATIAEALLAALDGFLPLEMKAGTTEARVKLEKPKPRPRSSDWSGVLTAGHVERFGERACPTCEMRLLIGETVHVPAGGELAYHPKCKPKKEREPGSVRVFAVAERHIEKRPGSSCVECSKAFQLGDSVAWRFGWTTMLHESCWLELGKPDRLPGT